MKHLSFARTGTARKRLISLALIVATLLTALVVIPISFSTKVEAAAPGGNAAGAFATPDNGMNTSTVFYASQWASHIATYGGGTDGLFGEYSQTNKANNGTENFYHNATSCFVFRYQAKSGKAPDPYVYWYGSSSHQPALRRSSFGSGGHLGVRLRHH